MPPPDGEPDHRSVAELVFDVSENASTLIREEIELAKTEVSEKVTKLLRGSAVGVAAGTFAFLALILAMEGIAWLLAEEVFDGTAWPGFFVEAGVFLLIAALAGADRLQSGQGRLAAGPRAGDRGGEADQGDAGQGGGEEVSANPNPEPPRPSTAGRPGRSAEEIRRDIDLQRQQLGTSVEQLRGRVTELTDWRRQVREHKRELIIGAAAVGFVVGVRLMFGRRNAADRVGVLDREARSACGP